MDGTLVAQNHSMDWPYLLERHPLPTSFKQQLTVEDYFEVGDGSLPQKYADIPEDMLEPM